MSLHRVYYIVNDNGYTTISDYPIRENFQDPQTIDLEDADYEKAFSPDWTAIYDDGEITFQANTIRTDAEAEETSRLADIDALKTKILNETITPTERDNLLLLLIGTGDYR